MYGAFSCVYYINAYVTEYTVLQDNTTRGHNWKLKKKHCRTDTRF